MTDKNRDFSQIRVDKFVAADQPPRHWGMVSGQKYQVLSLDRDRTGTVYATIRVSDLSRVVFYEYEWVDVGGYIVSQPEEFPLPGRKDGELPCGECHIQPGETCDICGTKQPEAREGLTLAERAADRSIEIQGRDFAASEQNTVTDESAEQVIVQTREEQIESIAHIGKDARCLRDNPHGWARRQVLEAEARGASEQRQKDEIMKKQIVIYQDGTYVELTSSPLDAAYRADDPGWLATVDIDGPDVRVGVSEQRLKDAEPVAWVEPREIESLKGDEEFDGFDEVECYLHKRQDTNAMVALYTAPQPDTQAAKIAELESIMDETGNSILRVTKLNDLQNQSISLMESKIAEQARHIQRLEETITEYVSDFRQRAKTITEQAATIAKTRREAFKEIIDLLNKEVSNFQEENLGPCDPSTGLAEYAKEEMLDWETDRLELIEKIEALAATEEK